jgi:hypothetical protein
LALNIWGVITTFIQAFWLNEYSITYILFMCQVCMEATLFCKGMRQMAAVGWGAIKLASGESVWLCGIDAPAVVHGQRPGQVIVSSVAKDHYGRMVAEVFVSAQNPQQPEAARLLNMSWDNRQMGDRCR